MKVAAIKVTVLFVLFAVSALAQNVELVGRIATQGDARGVFVAGNYAYVSCWDSGLVIIDVINPAVPVLISRILMPPGNAWDTHVYGRYAFVADDILGGLRIINVANPFRPQQVGAYDTPGWAYNLRTDGNYVYMADGSFGYFQVINVTDPYNPQFTSSLFTNGQPWGICVMGQYAYLANGFSFAIINISDPAAPLLVDRRPMHWGVRAVSVSGQYAYVSMCDTTYSFEVIDISSPDSMHVISSVPVPVEARDIFTDNNYAYIADSTTGILIYDISNPSNLILAGSYDTPGAARHVFVDKELIYVADSSSLIILRFSSQGVDDICPPENISLLQNYPNPFNAQTTISYNLSEAGSVTLSIYNIMGQKVATLIYGIEQAGEHRVVWDAKDVTSGIYFVRFKSGDYTENKKMLLLK